MLGGGMLVAGLAFSQTVVEQALLDSGLRMTLKLGHLVPKQKTKKADFAKKLFPDPKGQPLHMSWVLSPIMTSTARSVPPTDPAVPQGSPIRGMSLTLGSAEQPKPRESAGMPQELDDEEDEDDVPRAPRPGKDGTVVAPIAVRRPEVDASGGSPGGAQDDDLPDLSGEGYQMAPINYGGQLTSTFNLLKDPGGSTSTSLGRQLSLSGNSFVYAPWVAQVGGYGNLSTSQSNSTNATTGGESESQSRSLGLGGSANILPMSRFPLQVSFDRMETQVNADQASQRGVFTRLSANQRYRPEQGNDSYVMTFDHSMSESGGGTGTVTQLTGAYSDVFGEEREHMVGSNIAYVRSGSEAGNQSVSADAISAAGSHAWVYDDELSINNSAFLNLSRSPDSSSTVMQGQSNFAWRPYDDEDELEPYTVTGGGNLLHLITEAGGLANTSTFLSGQSAVNYRFSDQMAGNLSANASHFMRSNGDPLTNMGGNASLSYAGLSHNFNDYIYNWGASGGVGLQKTTDIDMFRYYNSNLYHGLSKAFPLSDGTGSINLGASEGIGLFNSSIDGANSTLSHNFNASWMQMYGPTVSSQLMASYTDNRTFGTTTNHTRNFSLNGTGRLQLSRNAQAGASFGLGWSWQELQQDKIRFGNIEIDPNPAPWSGSFGLNYSHVNPFDIPRLGYNASFSYAFAESIPNTSAGEQSGGKWLTNKVFNQNINYNFGRLNLQLMNVIVVDRDGGRSVILFGQIVRSLGN